MSSQELINEINSTQYAEDDLSDQMLDTTGYNDGIVAANAWRKPKAVQFITYKAIFKIMHGWSKPTRAYAKDVQKIEESCKIDPFTLAARYC